MKVNWKDALAAVLVICMIFIVFKSVDSTGYIGDGYVNQGHREIAGDNYVYTHCWKDGDIIGSWLDPIDSVLAHPDLPKQRMEMGKVLLKSLR